MVLMPGAHRGDHDAGVGKKTTHMRLGGGGCSVTGELSSCPLDLLVRELLDRLIRHGDKEPTTFLQFDGKRCWLDFNQSMPPADLLAAILLPAAVPWELPNDRQHQWLFSWYAIYHGSSHSVNTTWECAFLVGTNCYCVNMY